MKLVTEYRSRELTGRLASGIKKIMPREDLNFMEVCGSHTQSFLRFGLDRLLPDNLRLIAGPGCPVCVSHSNYVDQAVFLAKDNKNIILTFGDMLRVPGSKSSLESDSAKLADVRVVYSPLDSLKIAKDAPEKNVIFLAVGFETTAPTIASTILLAKKEKLKNLYFLTSLKLIPPAMSFLSRDKRLKLQGFLCPGHVSAIIGSNAYKALAKKYQVGCCVAGFEPVDMLEGILFLLQQYLKKTPKVENQYIRVVTPGGNKKAKDLMKEVFSVEDSFWRGFEIIPQSGLKIKNKYAHFSAEKNFSLVKKEDTINPVQKKCCCGDVLKGIIQPLECSLFSRVCHPENPIGPCMVSQEGACNAYYRYKRKLKSKN